MLVRCLPALLLALALGGCGGGAKSQAASQVAVKVNDSEISIHQVELAARRELALLPPSAASAVLRQSVNTLVDQELAAQAARKDNLDKDPRVVQLLELAKREVLARAWQDRLTENAPEPSSNEIDAYFNGHPALFNDRRLYTLQEALVAVPAEKAEALRKRAEATATANALADLLASEQLPNNARRLNLAAEEVPLAALERLASLKEGQTLVLPHPQGLRLLTVLSSSPAPLERDAATRAIRAFMLNERKAELARTGLQTLRQQASISYKGQVQGLFPAGTATPPAATASR
jgi:EpsD family peptidyl-prolyl cis-trans isomerase